MMLVFFTFMDNGTRYIEIKVPIALKEKIMQLLTDATEESYNDKVIIRGYWGEDEKRYKKKKHEIVGEMARILHEYKEEIENKK